MSLDDLARLIEASLRAREGLDENECSHEVESIRKQIGQRYSELKKDLSFGDAAKTAKCEIIVKLLAEHTLPK